MKILDTRLYVFLAIILGFGLGIAHLYGSDFERNNPNGIYLATLPADHEGPIPYQPAYPIGFGLALFFVAAVTVVPSFVLCCLAWCGVQSVRRLGYQLLVASLVASALFLISHGFVEGGRAF